MDHIKKYIAELIGTFVLVTFGCGTAVAVGCDSFFGSGYVLTALAFGLSIVAMAYSIGNISGCHVNPAVSLALLIRRQLSGPDFVGYVISQLIGALLGCLVLALVFGFDCGFGANQIQDTWTNGSIGGALVVEIILTFVFVIAVVGVTSKTNNALVCGLVIGLSLTLVHILGIALTGTSVNPARSLLPALFAGGAALEQVWIFIVGPLVGGALAALIYIAIEIKDKKGVAEVAEGETIKEDIAKIETDTKSKAKEIEGKVETKAEEIEDKAETTAKEIEDKITGASEA